MKIPVPTGDVLQSTPALASTAVEEGTRAISAMLNEEGGVAESDGGDFPCGIWTIPEIGYYGLTLAAAKAKGLDCEEGLATYDQCLRGRVFAPDGMLKLVFEKSSGVIKGVHIIGEWLGYLIHSALL